MTHSPVSLVCLSTLSLLPACSVGGTVPATEFRDTGGVSCPPQQCPPNSPRVNDYAIPELSLTGAYNEFDVRVVGIRDGNNNLRKLAVNGDELVAKTFTDAFVASGQGLVGWRIELQTASQETLFVHVRGYTTTGLSQSNHPYTPSAYALAYEDPDHPSGYVNVCPEDDDPNATIVTVIGGETYDRDDITVNAGMAGWVTLACAEEAGFKMKMLGYSPNVSLGASASPSTWEQRQATLKMITADYCGTGDSYTEQGTHVNWYNAGGSVGTPNYALAIEAYWTEQGAICLTTPRIPEVEVDCERPECTALTLTSYEWTTRVIP